jgi:glycosyltransferase involved in cell wall biosynthesis
MNAHSSFPFISIIIPVFNRPAMLKRALTSVFSQTYRNFECIVIDDGSDNDLSFVTSVFPDIVYVKQHHSGVSAARNEGIRRSQGELIAFLDSDDEWLPEMLEKHVLYLNTHPEYKISQTEDIWIRNGALVNQTKKHQKISGDIFERSLMQCMVSASSVLLYRELINETGFFNEKLPACEDYDYWLRVTAFHTVGLLNEKLLNRYAGHDDQLSFAYPMMDRFRILSLLGLLQLPLSNDKYNKTKEVLIFKCTVMLQGARKRMKYLRYMYYFVLRLYIKLFK